MWKGDKREWGASRRELTFVEVDPSEAIGVPNTWTMTRTHRECHAPEIDAWQDLHHRNISRLLDVNVTSSNVIYTFEGRCISIMDAFIRRVTLSEEVLLRLFAKMAHVAMYMMRKDWFHTELSVDKFVVFDGDSGELDIKLFNFDGCVWAPSGANREEAERALVASLVRCLMDMINGGNPSRGNNGFFDVAYLGVSKQCEAFLNAMMDGSMSMKGIVAHDICVRNRTPQHGRRGVEMRTFKSFEEMKRALVRVALSVD
jgi:hypothetical protein